MQTYPTWPNLAAMMFARAREWPDKPMLRVFRDGTWRSISWSLFARRTASCARHLRAAGVSAGDRVVICAENRPDYPILETALLAMRAVPVPVYTTYTVDDHAHVLRDSGARVAVVSNAVLAERFHAAADRAGGLDLLVVMDSPAWAAMLADTAPPTDIALEASTIPPTALACLIYTSGTGGAPKGVMLPHRAMLANREGVRGLIERLGVEGEPYLSFLPLSHSYEHTVGCFLLPSMGMEVVYSRGADRLAAEFQEIRPAIVTAVPRLFEVLHNRMVAQVEKEGGLKKRLFDLALSQGLRKMDGPPLSPGERLIDPILDRLVRDKVRARFGGRLKALVSGGARLDPELSGFFIALGLPLIQGYGQSEAGPVISVNLPWDNRRHTVGPPLKGVEARIAGDGELLIRGDLVMDGYWNNPEATARALRPGPDGRTWLHTGDVGRIEDGRIVITDRKRDFIKTLGGDMVSPAKLEGLLMAEPEIAQAVVAGEGQPGIVALLVPAEGFADSVASAVARVNAKLSSIERIRRWMPVPAAFSVENGLLTPTMKVRRRAVLERYRGELASLYR